MWRRGRLFYVEKLPKNKVVICLRSHISEFVVHREKLKEYRVRFEVSEVLSFLTFAFEYEVKELLLKYDLASLPSA